ncbi:MAG: hypothetical protein H7222_07010 [Methylotenera sp.]|nr:hypothetical protein [Oligoflexia bacterium]
MIQSRYVQLAQFAIAAALLSTSMVACKTAQMKDSDVAGFSDVTQEFAADGSDRFPASGPGSGLTEGLYKMLPAQERAGALASITDRVAASSGKKFAPSELKVYLKAHPDVDLAVAKQLEKTPGLARYFSNESSPAVQKLHAEVNAASKGLGDYQKGSGTAGFKASGLGMVGVGKGGQSVNQRIKDLEDSFLSKTAGNAEATGIAKQIISKNEEALSLYGETISNPKTCANLSPAAMKDYNAFLDHVVEDGRQVEKAGQKPSPCTGAKAAVLYQHTNLLRPIAQAKQAVSEMSEICEFTPKSWKLEVNRQPATADAIRAQNCK